MMKHQPITVLRYISLLQRNTQRYFDLALERDNIGGGQQFFLLRIFEQDGISLLDLARLGGVAFPRGCPKQGNHAADFNSHVADSHALGHGKLLDTGSGEQKRLIHQIIRAKHTAQVKD